MQSKVLTLLIVITLLPFAYAYGADIKKETTLGAVIKGLNVCPSGQYVYGISNTLLCSTPAGGPGTGDGSYNSTYELWAYNQTGLVTYNATYDAGRIWWYNQSSSIYNQFNTQWNSTYNLTYSLWAYNQTGLITYNATYDNGRIYWYNYTTVQLANATINNGIPYWYNHTLSVVNLYNAQWNSTYNSTYAGIIPNAYNHTLIVMSNATINNGLPLWYNHTLAVASFYGGIFNSTFNSTYALWSYNQTYRENGSLVYVGNLTGMTASSCASPGLMTGVTMIDGALSATCGGSTNRFFTTYNQTEVVMSNATINNGIKFWYNFTSLVLINATACNPATDKAIGLNYSNGVFTVTCATDLTGGAGSVNDYNHTLISMQNQSIGNVNSTRDLNNGNISCTQIKGNGGDADFCADATGAGASTPDYFEVDLRCENLLVDTFNSQTAIETGEVGMLGWGYAATGGSAAVATPTKGNHPGVIRLSTGTGVRGNITFELGQASRYWDSFTGNTTQTWVLNVSKPMTPQDNYTIYVGFMDNSGTTVQPVDCVGFFTNETVNGNWSTISCLNNARTINVTNWKVNESRYINLNVSITNLSSQYRIDYYMRLEDQTAWTLVATQGATTLPNTVARATGPAVVLKKFGGTTAITADIDYYWDKTRFQVCR